MQGAIATASEEDRATATLCLSLDAAGPDWHDYKSGQSTESCKCEEGDTKSTQALGTSSAQVTFQAQKTTCGQEEGQCRWPCKRTYGQGRTMERSNNSRRHAATARTTRKNAPAAAGREEEPPTEALTPSGRIKGKAPRTTLDREQASWRRTCNHNMGQGRNLERAKDNRRLSASVRTTRKHTCSDRARREAADRGSKPIHKEKGCSTNDHRRSRKTNTPDPYGDSIPKGRDNTKKQSKGKEKTH